MRELGTALEPSRDDGEDFASYGARRVLVDAVQFEEIYDRHSAVVYGLAERITGSRPAAEEITQDVFLRVWTRFHEFDPARGSVRTWLGVMTRGAAVSWVRSEVARSDRVERVARADGSRIAPDGVAEAVEQQLMRDDDAAVVRVALAQLTELQREALQVVYFGGFSHSEAAALLGAPLGTVKTRVRDGLRRLGVVLGESAN